MADTDTAVTVSVASLTADLMVRNSNHFGACASARNPTPGAASPRST
jgi:hypothetical protein